jgi:ribosome-associated protein
LSCETAALWVLADSGTCRVEYGAFAHTALRPKRIPISESPPITEQAAQRSLKLAMAAARTAEDNRGENILVLDMREITPVFDYFVIVTGTSRRQLHAISEEIDHCLEDELGDRRLGIEGYNESHWILLDYGNVVIHLFDGETREFYALEQFWTNAPQVALPWQDKPDAAAEGDQQ